MVTVRMQADLKLQVGTRLFYNCPAMSPEHRTSDAFFKKYGGREATVVGFTTKFVPPFNDRGLAPGVYYDGGFKVKFDDEDEIFDRLNRNHFVVIGPAEIVPEDVSNFVSPLPAIPAFYPLDVVARVDDLLATPRLVTSVDFDKDGRLVCALADTKEMEVYREQKEALDREEARSRGLWVNLFSFRSDEQVVAEDLRLLERGNGFQVYHDQNEMRFGSPEEELIFWAQPGLSKVVFENSNWLFSLSQARELVHVGKGEMVMLSHGGGRRESVYEVRTLHPRFYQFRYHVATLAAQVGPISVKESDPFKKLAGVLS